MTATNPHPLPTLAWVMTADAGELDSAVKDVAASLRAGGDDAYLIPAAINVVRRCLESSSEVDVLGPGTARPLLLAALVVLRTRLKAEEEAPILAGLDTLLPRLDKRKDDFRNPAIVKHITALVTEFGRPTGPELDGTLTRAAQGTPADAPESDPIGDWLRTRALTPALERAQRDLAILMGSSGQKLPVAFAEHLYLDTEVWEDPTFAVWIEALEEPFDADTAGVAGAALINARLREKRPRLFLRYPTSVVVQAIASRDEVDQLRDELRRDFAGGVLRSVWDCTWILEGERSRKVIRKLEVDKVSETLRKLFVRLGYAAFPSNEIGGVLPFDPAHHMADSPELMNQEDVEVRRPGLRDVASGEVLVQPIVGRPESDKVEKAQKTTEHVDLLGSPKAAPTTPTEQYDAGSME